MEEGWKVRSETGLNLDEDFSFYSDKVRATAGFQAEGGELI